MTGLAEVATAICERSDRHSGGTGHHDARRWGPCSQHAADAAAVTEWLAERLAAHDWIGAIVADVLDLLSAEGRLASAVEPGVCWHDSGVEWPSGERPRCELKAGHAGAHEWKRPSGGEAVWLETDPAARPDAQHEQGAL